MGFDTTHEIKIPKENINMDRLRNMVVYTVKQLNDTLSYVRNDKKLLNIVDSNDFYIIKETFNHWIFQSACEFCELLSKNINSHIYLTSIDETGEKGIAAFYNGETLTSNVVPYGVKIQQYEINIKSKGMRELQTYTIETNDREKAIKRALSIFKYENPDTVIAKVWSKLVY